MHVTKLVGVMFLLIFLLDLLAAIGVSGTFAGLILTSLVIGIFVILLIISRQPQNRYVRLLVQWLQSETSAKLGRRLSLNT